MNSKQERPRLVNRSGLLAGLGILLLVGCAVGSGADETNTSELATTPIDAGDPDAESITLKPPVTTPETDDDAGPADAGPTKDGGTTTPPPITTCNGPTTCMGATDLGYLSGDTDTSPVTTSGSTSQWFTIRVGEDDASIFANSLEMKAILISPPGNNFDLFVYVPGSDTRECSAVTQQSTSTSNTDQAGAEFGESGTLSNGSDDDRTITVEIRHVSGTCDPAAKWTLNLYGNQH